MKNHYLLLFLFFTALFSCSSHREKDHSFLKESAFQNETFFFDFDLSQEISQKASNKILSNCYRNRSKDQEVVSKIPKEQKYQDPYYHQLAHCFYLRDSLERSLFFAHFILSNTKNPLMKSSAYNLLGMISFKRGQYEEALQSLRTSLKFNPKSLVAKYNLSLLYFRFHDYGKVVRLLEPFSLKKDPVINFHLAHSLMMLNQLDKAKKIYDSLGDNFLSSLDVKLSYMFLLFKMNDYPKVRELISENMPDKNHYLFPKFKSLLKLLPVKD